MVLREGQLEEVHNNLTVVSFARIPDQPSESKTANGLVASRLPFFGLDFIFQFLVELWME